MGEVARANIRAIYEVPALGIGNPNSASTNQTLYASNPGLFGVITSTSVNPRLIQFALPLQF